MTGMEQVKVFWSNEQFHQWMIGGQYRGVPIVICSLCIFLTSTHTEDPRLIQEWIERENATFPSNAWAFVDSIDFRVPGVILNHLDPITGSLVQFLNSESVAVTLGRGFLWPAICGESKDEGSDSNQSTERREVIKWYQRWGLDNCSVHKWTQFFWFIGR